MKVLADPSAPELERCLVVAATSESAGTETPGALPPPSSSGLPPPSSSGLPSFAQYPAAEAFPAEPAEVDLASHPEAATFRTRLTAAFDDDARFAGHYRMVTIGCGTTCRSVWAVDLLDGRVRHLFDASWGVSFLPDSRLIVENDPAVYESRLEEMTVAEVEQMMETYGPPRFWVENEGEFELIGPLEVRIDPETRKLVAR